MARAAARLVVRVVARARRLVAQEADRDGGEAARTRLVRAVLEDLEQVLADLVELTRGELVFLVRAAQEAEREGRGLLDDHGRASRSRSRPLMMRGMWTGSRATFASAM